MDAIEMVGVGVTAAMFGLAFLLAGRRLDAGSLWAWSWVALIASGLLFELESEFGFGAACMLATLFPTLQLAGAFLYTERRWPRWLPVAGLLVGALRVSAALLGFRAESHLLSLPFELAALAGATALVLPVARRSHLPVDWLLVFGFGSVALAQAVDAAEDASTGGHRVAWVLWLAIGIPLASSQVLAALHRLQARLQSSLEEREGALRALRDMTRRFEVIADSAYDLITETDYDLEIFYASPSHAAVVGYEPEQLIGKSGVDNVHPVDIALLRESTADFLETGSIVHPPVRYRHRDGSWRWIEGSARRYETEDGAHRILAVNRDVTERFVTAMALAASQRRFRVLADNSRELMAEFDANARCVYMSPNVEHVLGFEPDRFLGRTLGEIAEVFGVPRAPMAPDRIEALHPEDLDRVNSVLASDGTRRLIETNLSSFEVDGETHAMCISRDITERAEMEERLRETQKLESLGLLAGGIAHDFNNLLVPILTNSDLLAAHLEPHSEASRIAAEIANGAERAAVLTQQLLAYAGRHPLRREIVDLHRIVDESARLVEPNLAPGVTLRRALASELPGVEGDHGQLGQVLLNLLINAADSMQGREGAIVVETGTCEALADDQADTPRVFIAVSDEGCGMSAQVRARMFDPFYSTKEEGRGLGLAAVQGILGSHSAAVSVDSAPGRGTRIRIELPASARRASRADRPVRSARQSRAGRILVVDDEDIVRRVTARALGDAGYTVVEADCGAAAIERVLEGPHFDCVVLDVTLPGQPGEQVWKEIQALRPGTPVVFLSGFASQDLAERLPQSDVVAFVQKPYRGSELIGIVSDLAGAPPASR